MNATVTVQSNQSWQDTRQNITDRQIARITAKGTWTANRSTGMVGPGGNPALIAKARYTLPGAPEGALIGRIGNNTPFVVGATAQAPAGQSGPLQLCINDDLDGAYGVGLKDNAGTLEVSIATSTTVTVQSNQSWQDSGQNITGREITHITAKGTWTANPSAGMVGPGGKPALIAKAGYTLPGEPEGALIGRIGDNKPFVVGAAAQVPAGQSGALQLCINDDLSGVHGAGLTDNRGTLEVSITSEPV